VERVHACTDVPAAVGFGIAGPEQAREVARFADGVIVGARLIEVIRDAAENGRADEVTAFIGSLRAALQHAEAASTGTCAAE
jgi:tryptophan synthase alpha chain